MIDRRLAVEPSLPDPLGFTDSVALEFLFGPDFFSSISAFGGGRFRRTDEDRTDDNAVRTDRLNLDGVFFISYCSPRTRSTHEVPQRWTRHHRRPADRGVLRLSWCFACRPACRHCRRRHVASPQQQVTAAQPQRLALTSRRRRCCAP